MGWTSMTYKDRAAFTLFVLGGPLDLTYEVYVVSAHYQKQGTFINPYYYGELFYTTFYIIDTCSQMLNLHV